MKIDKKHALHLWEEHYGNSTFAEDFHGNLMFRDAFGDPDFFIVEWGKQIYCGWNLHHILPVSHGGTNAKSNLVCTNIATNEEAGDKITYWIDDCLYQVKRSDSEGNHGIFRIR